MLDLSGKRALVTGAPTSVARKNAKRFLVSATRESKKNLMQIIVGV